MEGLLSSDLDACWRCLRTPEKLGYHSSARIVQHLCHMGFHLFRLQVSFAHFIAGGRRVLRPKLVRIGVAEHAEAAAAIGSEGSCITRNVTCTLHISQGRSLDVFVGDEFHLDGQTT
jgi:hypothetical protein